jgi:hypothetical protein
LIAPVGAPFHAFDSTGFHRLHVLLASGDSSQRALLASWRNPILGSARCAFAFPKLCLQACNPRLSPPQSRGANAPFAKAPTVRGPPGYVRFTHQNIAQPCGVRPPSPAKGVQSLRTPYPGEGRLDTIGRFRQEPGKGFSTKGATPYQPRAIALGLFGTLTRRAESPIYA